MDLLGILIQEASKWLRGAQQELPLLLDGVVVFAIFALAAKLARRVIRGALQPFGPSLSGMVATLAHITVLAVGVLLVLEILVPTLQFVELFTSLGVGSIILGFALKDMLENFAAGLLILWRSPFLIGDQIVSGGYEGTVEEINFRSTVLRTYDGVKVYLPNAKVFTAPLENRTGYSERRITVVLGIDQTAPIARAREVIDHTLRSIERVLRDPPPEVFFDAIGDFTNNIHVRYWIRPPTRIVELTTKSEVTERLYAALVQAGITFPYPIRTVHLDRLEAGEDTPSDGSGSS